MMKSAPRKEGRNAQTVSLRWKRWRKPVDGGDGPVSGYIVYYRAKGASEWSSDRVAGRTTRYVVKDLQPNTFYTFKVSPIHQEGFEGFASPELNVTTCGSKYTSNLGLSFSDTIIKLNDQLLSKEYSM